MAKVDPMMAMMEKFHKYKACMMIAVGILVILNAVYSFVNWALFVGIVLILVGLLSKIMAYKKK